MESCEGSGRKESRGRKRSCLAGSGERSAHRVGAKRLEARCSHRSGDGAQRFDRFSGVQQLVLKRRGMRQRLGALRGHVDVLEDVGDGRVLGNERDYLHFGATKRAQVREVEAAASNGGAVAGSSPVLRRLQRGPGQPAWSRRERRQALMDLWSPPEIPRNLWGGSFQYEGGGSYLTGGELWRACY